MVILRAAGGSASINLLIPLMWALDSGDVGRASERSDAGYGYDHRSAPLESRSLYLVRPAASFRFHHLVSGALLIPLKDGQDSAGKWGAIPPRWGNLFWLPTTAQISSGECGSAGTTSVVSPDLPISNQRFSISSILRRTCSQ